MNPQRTYEYDVLSRVFHLVTAIAVTITFVLGPDDLGRIMRKGVDPANAYMMAIYACMGKSESVCYRCVELSKE